MGRELSKRTDLDRVLFKCDRTDVCLAGQESAVGWFNLGNRQTVGVIVEVTGTQGVSFGVVEETYQRVCHRIRPSSHTSVPWSAIAGQTLSSGYIEIE